MPGTIPGGGDFPERSGGLSVSDVGRYSGRKTATGMGRDGGFGPDLEKTGVRGVFRGDYAGLRRRESLLAYMK